MKKRKEMHGDQVSLAWAGSRLIVGNDGGLFSSADGGNSWQSHNTNLSITQFYKGSLHPNKPNLLLAGSEDNGIDKWVGSITWTGGRRGGGAGGAGAARRPGAGGAGAS